MCEEYWSDASVKMGFNPVKLIAWNHADKSPRIDPRSMPLAHDHINANQVVSYYDLHFNSFLLVFFI